MCFFLKNVYLYKQWIVVGVIKSQVQQLIMSSQGRVFPPHLRRPLPGSGAVYPDPYSSTIPPPAAGFPPFEMLPPPEVMEHKLSAQHIEIEKLATENQRLAATHGSLRQDLATAKHDLQLVHSHILDMKSEKEHQTRGLMDKISTMEAELENSKRIKVELQQSRVEAQNLLAVRKELFAKVQQLTHDLQMAHSEAQQIPCLMSELDSLRQEYQHYRATYDYEKKLYHDHLESLQVMEKNNAAMTRELEKLRTELSNSTNFDPRTGGSHGDSAGTAGYNGSLPVANYNPTQNTYGAAQQQGQSPFFGGITAAAAVRAAATYDPYGGQPGAGYDSQLSNTGAGYDALRGPAGSAYNAPRGPTEPSYDAQRYSSGPGYDPHRWPSGPGYDALKGPAGAAYDTQRGLAGPSYGGQSGVNYDMQKVAGHDAPSRAATGSQGQVPANNNPSTTPSRRGGSGNDSVPRSGNPARI